MKLHELHRLNERDDDDDDDGDETLDQRIERIFEEIPEQLTDLARDYGCEAETDHIDANTVPNALGIFINVDQYDGEEDELELSDLVDDEEMGDSEEAQALRARLAKKTNKKPKKVATTVQECVFDIARTFSEYTDSDQFGGDFIGYSEMDAKTRADIKPLTGKSAIDMPESGSFFLWYENNL